MISLMEGDVMANDGYIAAIDDALKGADLDERLEIVCAITHHLCRKLKSKDTMRDALSNDVLDCIDDATSEMVSLETPLMAAMHEQKSLAHGKKWEAMCSQAHDAGYDYAADYCSWHEKDFIMVQDFIHEARCDLEGSCGDLAAGIVCDFDWPFSKEVSRVECLADHVYDGIVECMHDKGFTDF
jgi:hypothetical protein